MTSGNTDEKRAYRRVVDRSEKRFLKGVVYIAMRAVEPFPRPSSPYNAALRKEIVAAEFERLPVISRIATPGCILWRWRSLCRRGGVCSDHISLDWRQREHPGVVVVIVVAILRL